mmetsp:Transcript_2348/g.2042  ORF Transcript_2348/g.2042 Transcript_2348/m.2042 type:complete len:202 (+) Transcript_2348:558-1163(+)
MGRSSVPLNRTVSSWSNLRSGRSTDRENGQGALPKIASTVGFNTVGKKPFGLDDFKREEAERTGKLKKRYSDDPDEEHLEKQRNIVKYGDKEKEAEEMDNIIKEKNRQKIPSMMRERHKPAWDGIFKKFKEDKQVLTKIKTFEKHYSEFDIKSKDADRMTNYIPAVDLLEKIKTMAGKNVEKYQDSDMLEWGKIGLSNDEL